MQRESLSLKRITAEEYDSMFPNRILIGQGGFGRVYRSNKLALKQFKTTDNDTMRQSIEEIEIMLRFDHPNVLKVINNFLICSNSNNKLVLVTSYCSEGDLPTYILRNKLSYSKKVNIALQIARGVAQLHRQQYIHRDIKPQNIIIDDRFVAKIADMGLCIQCETFLESKNVGTANYSDPSIGNGNYGKEVDIFSLGLVYYYIFKEKPLLNGTLLEMHQHKKKLLRKNKQIIISWDIELKISELLMKMMHKRRIKAEQVVQILEQINKEEQIKIIEKQILKQNQQNKIIIPSLQQTTIGRVEQKQFIKNQQIVLVKHQIEKKYSENLFFQKQIINKTKQGLKLETAQLRKINEKSKIIKKVIQNIQIMKNIDQKIKQLYIFLICILFTAELYCKTKIIYTFCQDKYNKIIVNYKLWYQKQINKMKQIIRITTKNLKEQSEFFIKCEIFAIKQVIKKVEKYQKLQQFFQKQFSKKLFYDQTKNIICSCNKPELNSQIWQSFEFQL